VGSRRRSAFFATERGVAASAGTGEQESFFSTHSLELMEAAALTSCDEEDLSKAGAMLLCFDVLIQYLSTLAISDGFYPMFLFPELLSLIALRNGGEEWREILHFITEGE